jgi:hypothetical protein
MVKWMLIDDMIYVYVHVMHVNAEMLMLCLNDDPTRVFMRYVRSDHAIECHGMFEEAYPTICGVAQCRDAYECL